MDYNANNVNAYGDNAQRTRGGDEPIGVYDLMKRLRDCVETCFPYPILVRGEVSGIKLKNHYFFTLKQKEPEAQINAIIWKNSFDNISCPLREGMEVVCWGKLNVAPQYGRCSFIISSLQPYGVGQFEIEKQQIIERLKREGLMDASRKRRLPINVSRVGVVTSLSTAALQDFLKILNQRCKRVSVVVADSKVQGMEAPNEIVRALKLMYAHARSLKLDVIVLIRGGGSKEDLWTFNNEQIARTIAMSPVPLVTGIGHETDDSICDMVSDFRASTPSDAAARITPIDDEHMKNELDSIYDRMVARLEAMYAEADRQLQKLEESPVFRRPYETLYEKRASRLDELETRLKNAIQRKVADVERQFEVMEAKLQGRDPKAALSRGYSFTQRLDDMKILLDPADVKPGQTIVTTLAHGKIRSVVVE